MKWVPSMMRMPLYALLSLVLHAAFGWLVQGQWATRAYAQPHQAEARALLVMLAPLPVPASPSPTSVAPASTKPEVLKGQSVESRSSTPAKLALRPQPEPRAEKPAKPTPPAKPVSESVAVRPLVSRPAVRATAQPVPAAPAPLEEVFSREPSFLEPPRPPAYPSQARRRNQQGVVLIEVRLDRQGGQKALKVLRSSGIDSLDRAALAAISGWRFRPETHNGKAVPSRVHIPIQFALTANR